ncbi:hypothetical protein ES707_15725 [subsurface metagenome]
MGKTSAASTSPYLHFDLSEVQCKRVVEVALRLLNKTGIQCKSKIAQRFMAANPGVRVSANRVYFTQDFLEGYLAHMRAAYRPAESDGHFHQDPPWSGLNIADLRGGIVRPATENDLIKAVRLYEGMGLYGGVPPVVVGTVEPRYRDLLSTKVCLENSKSFGGPLGMPNERELDLFIKMFEVVGRKPSVLVMLIISPLKFNDLSLEFLLRHREDERIDISIGAGMPCSGSTAPLMFPAAFSLAFAEGLAASIFTHLCTEKYPMVGTSLGPFDFRYANYVVGSPEWLLLNMVSRKLFQYLTDSVSQYGELLSLARWPDAQAVHDHTISAVLQGLQGARRFDGSGLLSHDEVFSPEIVVIDRDILGATERIVQGIEWEEDLNRSLEVIHEGLNKGHFLDSETTLARFRDFFFVGDLFRGMNLGQWRKRGSILLIEEASRMVDRIVAEYVFTRSADQIRELEVIGKFPQKT